jgi:DNA-binding MarR family transcriptional regulator
MIRADSEGSDIDENAAYSMCMTHAHEVVDAACPAAAGSQALDALRALDEAMRSLRRLTLRPPEVSLSLPGTGRRLDFAKLLACSAIGGLCGQASDEAPVTVKTVAQALELDHSTVSRLLSEVEGDGLVTRSPHPTDRRSTVLSLTAEGARVIEGFEQARLTFLGGLLRDWSTQDIDTLATLMMRLADTAHERTSEAAGLIQQGMADSFAEAPGASDR